MRYFSVLLLATLAASSLSAIERTFEIEFESPLLASRGDAQLSHLEFDARMQAIPEDDRAGVLSSPDRIGKLLEDLLVTRTLTDRALQEGLLDDPLVRAELYHLISVRLSERYQQSVLRQAELDDYTNQAREIYLASPERFNTRPTVSFRHILIGGDTEDGQALAERLLADVRNGESFVELAREHSGDPSVARNEGLFEQVGHDELEARFRDGLEDIAVDATGIVESAYGWHVVEVLGREEPRRQEFEQIAGELREEARNRHRAEIWNRIMREVQAPELEITEGGIAELLERYPADAQTLPDDQVDAEAGR